MPWVTSIPRSSRRAHAWVCAVLLALPLAGCGGSSSKSNPSAPLTGSDQHQITQLIKAYGAEPRLLCTRFGTQQLFRAQFGSRLRCLIGAGSPGAKDPDVRVSDVRVAGTNATAVRTAEANPGKGTRASVSLIKQNGEWRVRSILGLR